jgi:hypothetical protein
LIDKRHLCLFIDAGLMGLRISSWIGITTAMASAISMASFGLVLKSQLNILLQYQAYFFVIVGNHALSVLTNKGNAELRVDLKFHNGTDHNAEYSVFSVAPEAENFALTAAGYSGNAGWFEHINL